MMNKEGNQQHERKRNFGPPSPSKGKSPIQIEDEVESTKNKYEPLETLEEELINSKENTKENIPDKEADLVTPLEDPDPQL